ncbi:hypothetical protein MKX01_002633 [Papaver californicum]|nr:hypothetical protein MKX01_002633 [Papaver californicum]
MENKFLSVKPNLQAGAFEIVDGRIEGSYDLKSMRKTAFVASRDIERDASQRPTLAQVLVIQWHTVFSFPMYHLLVVTNFSISFLLIFLWLQHQSHKPLAVHTD